MGVIDASDIESLPVISYGHSGDLKIDTGDIRVWVERSWSDYPEFNPITVERLVGGDWVTLRGWEAACALAMAWDMR